MADLNKDAYFQPFQSLRSGEGSRFVGRRDAIVRATAQMQGSGGALALIGERGVGKTSLGWKLFEILSGDTKWLKKNQVALPDDLKKFTCIWVECTQTHENLLGILLSILKPSKEDISDKHISVSKEFLDALSDESISTRVDEVVAPADLERFRAEVRASYEQEYAEKLRPIVESVVSDRNALYSIFREVISKVADRTGSKIFIFLDEMDRISDKTGIGDFIKTGRDVRFCTIGVFKDINELISDHPSAERKIIPYVVQPLSPNESSEIFFHANKILKKDKFQLAFSDHYIARASKYSGGFPFLSQRMGYEALVDWQVNPEQPKEFGRSDFYKNILQILQPEVDQGGRHKLISKKIQQKNLREILFFAAQQDNMWVPTSVAREHSVYRFDANINSLVAEGIFEKRGGQVKFTDPWLRAITLAYCDQDFDEYSE